MSEHGGPFKKGDPRINRKGRPRSFDEARSLAQTLAHEIAKSKDGQELVIDGHKVTITEAILRTWATSKDPRLQMYFFEIAYGKVPANLNIHVGFEELNKLTDEELLLIAAGKDSE